MAISSHGTLLKIGNGATPTETFTTIAEVLDISGPSFSLGTEETTHHGSEWAEYVATVIDGGEVTFDVNLVPSETTQMGTSAGSLWYALTNRVLNNFKLVLPDSGAMEFAFAAYVTKFELSEPLKGKLGASLSLKISGEVTVTA